MQSLIGASLLSAAASLPLHLLPLLVAAVIAEGRLSMAQAGWIATACMSGILFSSVALPSLGFKRITRAQALAAMTVVPLGMWLSSSSAHTTLLLACWFVMGAGCGVLYFLATTTAAAEKNREAAFSVRLSVTLIVSGGVIVAIQMLRGFASYSHLSAHLTVAFVVLMSVGWMLYREPALTQQAKQPASKASAEQSQRQPQLKPRHFLGLAIIFGLFLGQQGFWAYAAETVKQRGVDMAYLAFAIAASKVVAGGLLYANARRAKASLIPTRFWMPGVGLSLAVLLMGAAQHALTFMVGVLLWEMALNILSARTQAAVVKNNPRFGGLWLTAAVFSAAALGPALHGWLLQLHLGSVFWVFAAVSALLPFAWVSWRAQAYARMHARATQDQGGESKSATAQPLARSRAI
jgi:MFS family permease